MLFLISFQRPEESDCCSVPCKAQLSSVSQAGICQRRPASPGDRRLVVRLTHLCSIRPVLVSCVPAGGQMCSPAGHLLLTASPDHVLMGQGPL